MIGAAEAGFFPGGCCFYLTLWSPNRLAGTHHFAVRARRAALRRPRRAAVERDHGRHGGLGRIAGWRWLFLIEGAPAIALGVPAWLILPDRPGSARFLLDDAGTSAGTLPAAERSVRGR